MQLELERFKKQLTHGLVACAPKREALLKGQNEVVPFRNIHQKTYFKAVTHHLQSCSKPIEDSNTVNHSMLQREMNRAKHNIFVSPSQDLKAMQSAKNLN